MDEAKSRDLAEICFPLLEMEEERLKAALAVVQLKKQELAPYLLNGDGGHAAAVRETPHAEAPPQAAAAPQKAQRLPPRPYTRHVGLRRDVLLALITGATAEDDLNRTLRAPRKKLRVCIQNLLREKFVYLSEHGRLTLTPVTGKEEAKWFQDHPARMIRTKYDH